MTGPEGTSTTSSTLQILIRDRSAGPNSLSIYTHNLRGINIDNHSVRAKAHGAVAEVTIAAGMRMFEIYKATKDANLTVVGGGKSHLDRNGLIGVGVLKNVSTPESERDFPARY